MKAKDKLAIDIIIYIVRELYGYDFTNYSKASFIRRLTYHQNKKQLPSISDMIPLLIRQDHFFDELLSDLSITVTEMFRNPEFFKVFSEIVIPKLKTYPFFKVWHAGCATGEEVYSMAILLEENHCLNRAQLYATDFNPYALKKAKRGIYPIDKFPIYEKNYHEVNASGDLRTYFIEKYQSIKVKKYLQERIAFSQHNLVTDNVFSEVEVVVCRNVLIYFDNQLKERALELFYNSLVPYGFLCLGNRESISSPNFKCLDQKNAIYQKVPK